MADLAFSTTLLGQFLEDMEAYAEVKALVISPCFKHQLVSGSAVLVESRALDKNHTQDFTGITACIDV